MASKKIRIKLWAYEHSLVDQAAERIVETARRTGSKVSGTRATFDAMEKLDLPAGVEIEIKL